MATYVTSMTNKALWMILIILIDMIVDARRGHAPGLGPTASRPTIITPAAELVSSHAHELTSAHEPTN